MIIKEEVKRYKMELLRKLPFYGDIVMRLPFVSNKTIPTARTDGGKIEYNPDFLASLSEGQRNFVLMHEIFHVLLFHCKRQIGRDPRLWNTAADMIVNSMLVQLTNSMNNVGIPFARPKEGIFAYVESGDTVENIYEALAYANRQSNNQSNNNSKQVLINTKSSFFDRSSSKLVDAPDDIIWRDDLPVFNDNGMSSDNKGLSELSILQIIRESASANRSGMGSYFVPDQIFELTESRHIKWQDLLREFLQDEQNDETSYTTPERKYIHMDLIIPGYASNEEKLEEVWAFVDSSGSIGKDEMNEFLTQLYRISKEFKCVFNICYWDTQVTDIYKKVLNEKDIFKSLPKHSGGTDINCVYRWINDNKLAPDVMIILTDGYFGQLNNTIFKPSLGRKTILVLNGSIQINNDMKRIGKIARL